MGLIILIVVGGLIGWFGTIFLRIEDGTEIFRNIVVGTAGSLVVGVATSGGLFLGSIRGSALLWAILGAVAAIAVYRIIRQRAVR